MGKIKNNTKAKRLKSFKVVIWRMKDDNFKLLGVLLPNGQTDEQTFVIVESLS